MTLASAGLPLLALACGLLGGGRSAAAATLTGLLVTCDFLWAAAGLRALSAPGDGVPRGVYPRALGAFAGRTVLLLLGLYAILTILPGEGPSAAAGIGVPLILLAVAGLSGARN